MYSHRDQFEIWSENRKLIRIPHFNFTQRFMNSTSRHPKNFIHSHTRAHRYIVIVYKVRKANWAVEKQRSQEGCGRAAETAAKDAHT